ncbi:MAG: hypothetical protein Q8R13_04415 [bacterium]|nr:hypothetical protein [bacterium]MDZ4285209.1 hypothetical protein [Patescibacteria group bacterium]
MRLFEVERIFGGLPKKAGVAVLEWKKGGEPARDGKTIYLPTYEEVQFFPLLDGVQFLLQIPRGEHARAFFGGTDEQPFLVELEPSVIASLRGGEEEFFNSIKPNGAKVLEEAFDTKAVRQGDWFAVPLPLSWKATCGMTALVEHDPKVIEPSNEKKHKIQLRGTRHDLFVDRYISMKGANRLECTLIGEGLLRAPDHKDRVLKGPHAFFQTAHLVNPREAD